jgi:hypothetical protein
VEWLLFGLGLVAWAWYSSASVKEVAVRAARRACERHHQQLLDETVALKRIRLRRDQSGQMRFLRSYGFEFSGDGEQRYRGEIELLGLRLVATNLSLDGFTLYEQVPDNPHNPHDS